MSDWFEGRLSASVKSETTRENVIYFQGEYVLLST